VIHVRRTGFSEDKRIRARTTDQFIVADPADQDVIAVAADQKVAPAAAGEDVISSPPSTNWSALGTDFKSVPPAS